MMRSQNSRKNACYTNKKPDEWKSQEKAKLFCFLKNLSARHFQKSQIRGVWPYTANMPATLSYVYRPEQGRIHSSDIGLFWILNGFAQVSRESRDTIKFAILLKIPSDGHTNAGRRPMKCLRPLPSLLNPTLRGGGPQHSGRGALAHRLFAACVTLSQWQHLQTNCDVASIGVHSVQCW